MMQKFSPKTIQGRRNLTAYLFLLPNFLGFLIFIFIPIVISVGLSFTSWDSANPAVFVGLKNYTRMFADQTFWISLRNTLHYVVATVPLTMVFSLILAMILNNQLKGSKFFRALYFFPHVASLVAVAVVWNQLFHPTIGPVNMVLRQFGIQDPPGWTASVKWAMWAVIIVSVWKSMGYYMVLYLSGLQSIPKDLYEAAKIDGVNKWQEFRSITLPMLTPTTFFVCIMLMISSFKVFDLISVMTNGGPGRATNVLVKYIYDQAFISYQFGYASAVAVVLAVIVIVVTVIQFMGEKKWVTYM